MHMSLKKYVHGYTDRESERLYDQAQTLTTLLHEDTRYTSGSHVLEAGCGIGAQTVILAKNSPGAYITSVDISADSLRRAEGMIRKESLTNVTFCLGDIFHLPFPSGTFDHIFVCFVLEHLTEPQRALERLRPLLKEGGTITVIEGDHGSAFFHPKSRYAQKTIDCLVNLQRNTGGNALIGRQLYPLLVSAGFDEVLVSPRMVYVDASRPVLQEGFNRLTFTAMVEGVRDSAIEQGMISPKDWERGIRALSRTCGKDGVFCYTFFRATGTRS
jgi:ubiquinone/menaquinone biosynthesis C-methylase UbiE